MPRFPGLNADNTFETPAVHEAISSKVAADIDTPDTPVRTALNAAIGEVNLTPGGTADTGANRAALQAAVDAAGPGGRLTIPAGTYYIRGGVNLPNPFTIEGKGRGTKLVQVEFPAPIFEARDGGATVRNITGGSTWNGDYTGHSVIEDGTYNTMKHALLLSWGDDSTLEDAWVEGLTVGGCFLGWDFTTSAYKPAHRPVARRVHVEGTNFGVYFRSCRDITWDEITGSYALTIGMEPHLVYTAAPTAAPELDNTILHGGPCHAVDGESSYAYQFKYTTGRIEGHLRADGCAGILHVMDSTSLHINNLTSVADTWASKSMGSVDIDTGSVDVHVGTATVIMAGDGMVARLANGATDSSIGTLTGVANHTTDGVGTDFDAHIRGTRNTIGNADITNVGAQTWGASIGIWDGTGNRIVNLRKVSGAKHGVTIRTSTGSEFLDYDPANITGTTGKFNIGAGAAGLANRPKASPLNQIGQDRVLLFENGSQPVGSAMTLGRAITGQQWTAHVGIWRADGTTAYANSGVANSLASVDLGTPNVDLSAGVKYAAGEGLLLRFVDANNYAAVRLRANQLEIVTRVGGSQQPLVQHAMTTTVGRRYQLRAVVFGDSLEVYVDGVSIVTHTLSATEMTAFGASTRHGLYGQGDGAGRYDTVLAHKID